MKKATLLTLILICVISTYAGGDVFKKNDKYETPQDAEVQLFMDLTLSDSLGMFNGYSYEHYREIYERAAYRKKGGILMTCIGAAGVGSSFFIRSNLKDNQTANVTFVVGLVFMEIGIPIWIANGIVAQNNKEAMEKAKRNTSLSLSTTENGIGLVMRF